MRMACLKCAELCDEDTFVTHHRVDGEQCQGQRGQGLYCCNNVCLLETRSNNYNEEIMLDR